MVESLANRASGPSGQRVPDPNYRLDALSAVSFVSYWAGLLLAVRIVGSCVPELRVARHQVTEINAFRIDSPTGVWEFALRPNKSCPVGCRASQDM
jgi:hypothetical protein